MACDVICVARCKIRIVEVQPTWRTGAVVVVNANAFWSIAAECEAIVLTPIVVTESVERTRVLKSIPFAQIAFSGIETVRYFTKLRYA